jgi:MFS family permease
MPGTPPAAEELTAVELRRARRHYYAFEIFNSVSFKLVAGSIVTLYALDLGAGNTLVGMLESFLHVSLLFQLAGRALVPRLGAVRVMTRFWAARYVLLTPVVFTALPAVRANPALALTLLTIGVFCFHAAKGTALASQNPILGMVAGERDRGAFLSRLMFLDQPLSIVTWLIVGFVLARTGTNAVYGAFFAVGIVVGLIGALQVGRLPEPAGVEQGAAGAFLRGIAQGLADPSFRHLALVMFVRNGVLAMTGPFLIVFFKRVYQHSDSDMVIITLAGNVGVLLMASLAGLLMDRVGSRPLFFTFAVTTAAIIVPVLLGKPHPSGPLFWIVPAAVFFVYSLGANGMGNCSQDYFFATVRPEDRLNLGVVYNIVAGISGFVGAFGGGAVLDMLESGYGLEAPDAFRVYFAAILGLMVLLAVLVYRLPGRGSYTIRSTLSIIFSPQDLRALVLLKRLDRSQTPEEESETLRALAESPSSVSTEDLLQRLGSPSFVVRSEALNTLRTLETDPAIDDALIREVRQHEYATAALAADILGEHRCRAAVEALRDALHSRDTVLCGAAMVALARIGDGRSFVDVRAVFGGSANPRVLIHGARALAVYGDLAALDVLLGKLAPRIAPFVRDEIVLAIADIIGMGSWFYRLYSEYLADADSGLAQLRGAVPDPGRVAALVAAAGAGGEGFAAAAAEALGRMTLPVAGAAGDAPTDAAPLLAAAAAKPELGRLGRLRFLIAAAVVWPMATGTDASAT